MNGVNSRQAAAAKWTLSSGHELKRGVAARRSIFICAAPNPRRSRDGGPAGWKVRSEFNPRTSSPRRPRRRRARWRAGPRIQKHLRFERDERASERAEIPAIERNRSSAVGPAFFRSARSPPMVHSGSASNHHPPSRALQPEMPRTGVGFRALGKRASTALPSTSPAMNSQRSIARRRDDRSSE